LWIVIGVLILGLIGTLGWMSLSDRAGNAAIQVPEAGPAAALAVSPVEEAQRFTSEWYQDLAQRPEPSAAVVLPLNGAGEAAWSTEIYWELAKPAYFTERYWRMAEARAARSARSELLARQADEPAYFTEPYWKLAEAAQARHDVNSAAPSGAYYTEKYWRMAEPVD
jgi:hypothetical protein